MLQFTDRNTTVHQQARDRKANELRIGRKYLAVAHRLGLSDKSTTVRSWTRHLQYWRSLPIHLLVADMQRKQS